MIINRYKSTERIDGGAIIHADTADVLVIALTEDVIRVRVSFNRDFPEASYALVTTAWEDALDDLFKEERTRIRPLGATIEESESAIEFSTPHIRLVLNKEPFFFSLYDSSGECIYQDLRDRAYEKDNLGRITHYSCMDRQNDHFFGFGEKTGHLDKKGRRLRMSPKDAIGHDPEHGDPMYKHIPFYMRVNDQQRHTLGLFYNNSYDCVFDMGQEISGYWERYCYYQADGGDIDLFFINGPSPAEVLERYTWLTGRPILPSKQSLGYCASTMYYAELEKDCDQEIYRVIEKHRKEKINIDNFWLASGYSAGEEDGLRYTFHWNRRRFPDPEGFLLKMRDLGINVICNLKPGVLPGHPWRNWYEEHDAFIKTADRKADATGKWWGGTGKFVDFTSRRGRDAWQELLEKNILMVGTKTVWNDNCEMDGIEDRDSFCEKEGLGGTMAELKVIHSNMMAYTAHKAIRNVYPNERPYVINRAGFAGIQRYAQVWGGDNLTDWRTLKFNVATIIGMGLSGCANMGCDIGGFAGGAPEAELLLRWIQNGIFQPRFVINSANNDNTVTQPWMYEEFLPEIRKAFVLRYRMLPYLYSCMYESSVTGMPVMRPLFLEFPEDPACYRDEHLTFLFGRSLLIANILEKGANKRELYLPSGCTWYDMGDDFQPYEGGQNITIPVNLETIPMFLRGDGILCTTEDIKCISSDTMKQLDFLMAVEKNIKFIHYEDDGHTKDYKRGVYSKMEVSVRSGERTVISFHREGTYRSTIRHLTLTLVSKNKGAFWVTVDEERIPRFIVKDNWEDAQSGWYYHITDRTIRVKTPIPEIDDFEIIVSTEPFDLIGMTD